MTRRAPSRPSSVKCSLLSPSPLVSNSSICCSSRALEGILAILSIWRSSPFGGCYLPTVGGYATSLLQRAGDAIGVRCTPFPERRRMGRCPRRGRLSANSDRARLPDELVAKRSHGDFVEQRQGQGSHVGEGQRQSLTICRTPLSV